MTIALVAAVLASQPALSVEVYVPLCDSALIACGRGVAGDPESLEGNVYWGAMYGAERFLSKAPGFKKARSAEAPFADRPYVLRVVDLVRGASAGEREVKVRLLAYSGKHIDDAVRDFFAASAGATDADLVVWAGHDRLMDVDPPRVAKSDKAKPVAVLACESQTYFGPPLKAIGARPVALTRTFMAPEAYLLEALAAAVAKHGVESPAETRQELIRAYAKYQRISEKAAGTVFAKLSVASSIAAH